MSTQAQAAAGMPMESRAKAPATISAIRIFRWSVEREFWEHRSLYLAPLSATGLFLAGFLIGLVRLRSRMQAAMAMDAVKQHEAIVQPYHFIEYLLMGTMLIVAAFYCIDALHGERRDRSILFWKSLPVSDWTTVLAKACIPILILPVFCTALTVATQWIMLLLSSLTIAGNSGSVAMLWGNLPITQMSAGLVLHLVGVHGLWYAPFYGWLLLVSAWARRGAILWATLPLLAVGIVEKIAFGTSYFAGMLLYQFSGGTESAQFVADTKSIDPLRHTHIPTLPESAGLWLGLVVAAIFLTAAVQQRRHREPM